MHLSLLCEISTRIFSTTFSLYTIILCTEGQYACFLRELCQSLPSQTNFGTPGADTPRWCRQRLVRFLAKDGRIYYGDAVLPRGVTDIGKTKQAKIITGDVFGKHDVTDEVADVRMLLAPLAPEHVKTVRCLGLNYEKHAHEVCRPDQKSHLWSSVDNRRLT